MLIILVICNNKFDVHTHILNMKPNMTWLFQVLVSLLKSIQLLYLQQFQTWWWSYRTSKYIVDLSLKLFAPWAFKLSPSFASWDTAPNQSNMLKRLETLYVYVCIWFQFGQKISINEIKRFNFLGNESITSVKSTLIICIAYMN